MTPDAHMVETLRLRTAALHRVSRSNDLLRRENDDLRARLARVEALADQWQRKAATMGYAGMLSSTAYGARAAELCTALDCTP